MIKFYDFKVSIEMVCRLCLGSGWFSYFYVNKLGSRRVDEFVKIGKWYKASGVLFLYFEKVFKIL